jgi:hypothetical protein
MRRHVDRLIALISWPPPTAWLRAGATFSGLCECRGITIASGVWGGGENARHQAAADFSQRIIRQQTIVLSQSAEQHTISLAAVSGDLRANEALRDKKLITDQSHNLGHALQRRDREHDAQWVFVGIRDEVRLAVRAIINQSAPSETSRRR